MVVLALETVSRVGSMALWVDGVCEARCGSATHSHAERLPGELLALLAGKGLTLDDVHLFAVVTGPGSFTGLRVGIAAIQGLALAGQRPAAGIPTLDALASTWRIEHDEDARVIACLDGQRGEVFVAGFDVATGRPLDDCPVVLAPAVARPDVAAARIAGLKPPAGRLVLVGDGAVRYADVFRVACPDAEIIDAPRPLAEAAAILAAAHLERGGAPHALRAVYLRQPDVVLARQRAARLAGSAPDACVIRRATGADDLEGVEALQRKTFTNPWGAEAIRWELENTDVARLYVLHEPSGSLVAYCACWMVFDELHINSVAVDPDFRRRGLARQLLRHVMADAAGGGATSATLEVRSSNEAARRLYEGLGFHVEGARHDYYRDPREDALILWHRAVS